MKRPFAEISGYYRGRGFCMKPSRACSVRYSGGDVQQEMRSRNLIGKPICIEGVPEELGADEVAQGVNTRRAKQPLSASLQLKLSWEAAEHRGAKVEARSVEGGGRVEATRTGKKSEKSKPSTVAGTRSGYCFYWVSWVKSLALATRKMCCSF